MAFINSVVLWLMKERLHQIQLFEKYPGEVQRAELRKLLSSAANTEYGKKYGFASVQSEEDFRRQLPICNYDDLKPYIDRIRAGEQQILWSSEIKWFAKSSGTTNDKSKFIPVSNESLTECHYKGGKDLYALYVNNYPETKLFSGMNLSMGGSHHICENNSDAFYGDVSAIIMQNLPFWAEFRRVPNLDIALMNEWEEKINKMAKATIKEDVTNIAGVPSWTLVLFNKILEITGKNNITEVWPNLETFFHGGVSFSPYIHQFQSIIQKPDFHYMETYNASEGFFGIQDQKESGELLLMLDYGVYYEFVPLSELENAHPKCLGLEDVELETNYAILISTNAGLWRYMIGDTVQFTSKNPYRIRISGRTKHYINTFGEELIVDNADKAIRSACEKTHAMVNDYTAAPVYMDEENQACHQWLIEFEQEPENLGYFTELLDNALKSCNSDYEAKRYKNMVLKIPMVQALPKGTFYTWMKKKGKLGGQHKVPRLANHRKYVEEILLVITEPSS